MIVDSCPGKITTSGPLQQITFRSALLMTIPTVHGYIMALKATAFYGWPRRYPYDVVLVRHQRNSYHNDSHLSYHGIAISNATQQTCRPQSPQDNEPLIVPLMLLCVLVGVSVQTCRSASVPLIGNMRFTIQSNPPSRPE